MWWSSLLAGGTWALWPRWLLPVVLLAACTPAGGSAPAAPAQPTAATSAAATPAARAATPSAGQAATPAAAARTETLKGSEFGTVSDAVIYLGQDRGYFREQGLELDLTRVDPPQVAGLLATNQIDFGVVSTSAALFQAFARGVQVRMVADGGSQSPEHSSLFLQVRKDVVDSGRVRDYPDLRGLTLALTGMGGGTSLFLGRALERGGLSWNDLNIVNIPYPDMAAAFANGAIEAAMYAEPFATISAQQGTSVKWRTAGQIAGSDVPLLLLQYAPDLFGSKRAQGERFMVAYTRAARDYYEAFVLQRGDRAGAIEILTRRTALKDPALYEAMDFSTINPNPYVDLPAIQAQQEFFIKEGMTQELRQPVDLTPFVDRTFVDYALGVLGPYRP